MTLAQKVSVLMKSADDTKLEKYHQHRGKLGQHTEKMGNFED